MGNPGNTEKVIAICDSDISYAGRLVEYLRQEAAFPCEIRLYTGADKLLEDPGVQGHGADRDRAVPVYRGSERSAV